MPTQKQIKKKSYWMCALVTDEEGRLILFDNSEDLLSELHMKIEDGDIYSENLDNNEIYRLEAVERFDIKMEIEMTKDQSFL